MPTPISSIAVPPLGCGSGGLDWKQGRPLIATAALDRLRAESEGGGTVAERLTRLEREVFQRQRTR